jgi:hypothetical protein
VLSGGADVVYLFNYFQHGHPRWPIPEYQQTLKTFRSLDAMLKLSRRHAVTLHDISLPGEPARAPLPAKGTQLAFAMALGPVPPAGWQCEVIVELSKASAEKSAPSVAINKTAGKLLREETLKNESRVVTYGFPATVLSGKNNDQVAINSANGKPVTVQRVEVRIYA